MKEEIEEYLTPVLAIAVAAGAIYLIYLFYAMMFGFIYKVFAGGYHLLEMLIDKL